MRADFYYKAELVSFGYRKMARRQPGGAIGRSLSETVTGSNRKAVSFRTHSVGSSVSAVALRGVGGGSSHQRVVDRAREAASAAAAEGLLRRGRSPAPRPGLRCMRNVQTDCAWYPIVDGGVSEEQELGIVIHPGERSSSSHRRPRVSSYLGLRASRHSETPHLPETRREMAHTLATMTVHLPDGATVLGETDTFPNHTQTLPSFFSGGGGGGGGEGGLRGYVVLPSIGSCNAHPRHADGPSRRRLRGRENFSPPPLREGEKDEAEGERGKSVVVFRLPPPPKAARSSTSRSTSPVRSSAWWTNIASKSVHDVAGRGVTT